MDGINLRGCSSVATALLVRRRVRGLGVAHELIIEELFRLFFASGHIHKSLSEPLGGSHAQRRLPFPVVSLRSHRGPAPE